MPIRTFKQSTAETLVQVALERKTRPQNSLHGAVESLPTVERNFICKANADIGPIDGNAPGSGAATIWKFDEDDELVETDQEVTVFNLSKVKITAGEFLVGIFVGKRRVIIFESCSGDEESE